MNAPIERKCVVEIVCAIFVLIVYMSLELVASRTVLLLSAGGMLSANNFLTYSLCYIFLNDACYWLWQGLYDTKGEKHHYTAPRWCEHYLNAGDEQNNE